MRRHIIASRVLAVSLSCMLAAQWLPSRLSAAPRAMELTPMAGYRSGGSFEDPDTGASLDVDERQSFGLILNVDHGQNTQWEFLISRQGTELQTGAAFVGDRLIDLDVTYATAGGIYVWRDPKVEPFLGAGIGITHMSPGGSQYDSETRVLFSLVGGYKFWLTDRIGLRVEIRGYETLMSSDAAIFCGNGACVARMDGNGFGQLELNAGLSIRF